MKRLCLVLQVPDNLPERAYEAAAENAALAAGGELRSAYIETEMPSGLLAFLLGTRVERTEIHPNTNTPA